MDKTEYGKATYDNFHVVTDADGIVTVSLNVPDRAMNVFDQDVMQELSGIIDRIERSSGISAVVFRSDKESGFLAGADVNVIAGIRSPAEADRLIRAGQDLFSRIERLPMPTIVVIHGPCLGGGLEFALACDHRIARDNSSTQIGLPEIKLGLIPGWGGTQRLPKRVGMRAALEMILQGRFLDARQSRRIGLIDQAIAPEDWESGVARFIESVHNTNQSNRRHSNGHPISLLNRIGDQTGIGRRLLLWLTRRKIAGKACHYPAIPAAMIAIAAAYQTDIDGFAVERTQFTRLISTETSRNLLGVFLSRERARDLRSWTDDPLGAHDQPIRHVGVVGGGAMGAGIGQLAACRGFQVDVLEVDPEAAAKSCRTIDKLLDKLADRKRWSKARRTEVAERIHVGCDPKRLADCDLVIEAVVERESVKHDVFEKIDALLKPSGILATNTSSLSVDRLAVATGRQEQFAGLHFFNPVHRMELVEVVRGKGTCDAAIAKLVAFVRALGKTPVVTSDGAGFLVNRVLFPYLGEAVTMVREGFEVDRIDREVRHFGMPMGPLELLDQVGLDVGLHVARSLKGTIGDTADVVDALAVMCEHGRMGKKSGHGFYNYKRGKRMSPAELPSGIRNRAAFLSRQVDSKNVYHDDGFTDIQRRVVYPMLAESIRCLDDGIVSDAWVVDLAMVLGTGFAPHTGGPLHLIDDRGVDLIRNNFDRLATIEGDRFISPRRLRHMSDHGETFFTQEAFATSGNPLSRKELS